MSKDYFVLLSELRREQRVESSRFIATLAPASTIVEARAFIARIKRELADASHNVPVNIIGGGNAVTRTDNIAGLYYFRRLDGGSGGCQRRKHPGLWR